MIKLFRKLLNSLIIFGLAADREHLSQSFAHFFYIQTRATMSSTFTLSSAIAIAATFLSYGQALGESIESSNIHLDSLHRNLNAKNYSNPSDTFRTSKTVFTSSPITCYHGVDLSHLTLLIYPTRRPVLTVRTFNLKIKRVHWTILLHESTSHWSTYHLCYRNLKFDNSQLHILVQVCLRTILWTFYGSCQNCLYFSFLAWWLILKKIKRGSSILLP